MADEPVPLSEISMSTLPVDEDEVASKNGIHRPRLALQFPS